MISMTSRRSVITILFALSIVFVLLALARGNRHAMAVNAGASQPVRTIAVVTRDVAEYIQALGTVTPTHTVAVRAQTGGTLTSVRFREGQEVKAGDVLATIDDRALQAQLRAAEGALQRDQAGLANARIDLARYRNLLQAGSATRQQVDTQSALTGQYEGTVKSDQGSVDNLRVQLGFTRIAAPIDGIAGLRSVDAGNIVQPGDSAGIVTLTSVSPTTVKFAVPEDDLDRILVARGEPGTPPLPVFAFRRDGATLLAAGSLGAMDNRIDASTGTVMIRADFANADHSLFPNQFVNVRLLVNTLHQARVVPTRAIQHGVDGDYVYVVVEGKASRRRLLAGPVDGDDTVVFDVTPAARTESVQAGDAVIVDGADALDDGSPVRTGSPIPAGSRRAQ